MDSAWFRGVWVVLVTTGGAAAYPKCEVLASWRYNERKIFRYTLQTECLRKLCLKMPLMEG